MKGIIILLFICFIGCEHSNKEPKKPVKDHNVVTSEKPVHVSSPPPPPPVALPPKPAPPPSYKNDK